MNTDGASQHYATVLGFTNSTDATCKLPSVEQVVGVVPGGTVTAEPGGYFPIRPAADTVTAGDRAELVLTTTALDLCSTTTPVLLRAVSVTMSEGSVIGVPVSIDAGCGLWFSQLGSWD